MKPRQRARFLALQALFEIDSVGHDPEEVVRRRLMADPLPPTATELMRSLVFGVLREKDRLDALISRFAPEWPVEQLPIVDRNILRMALWELTSPESDTPVRVAINEAVELAKLFGSESSPRFINGVLGMAVRTLGIEDAREDSARSNARREKKRSERRRKRGGRQ
ncbi:MAG: transcription antitermination factor NusB [Chloroflexi bacterium]|nr:transcription antitermination factor NusB [Chloroflexota bacterium]